MIVEDEQDVAGLEDIIIELQDDELQFQRGLTFDELLCSIKNVENVDTHHGLRVDLIEHLRTLKGTYIV